MSSENVELVKALLPQRLDFVQIAEAGLPEEFWSGFEPDFEVEFVSSMPDLDRPTYRGAEGIAEGWREWLTPWESYSGDVEEILDAGDDVVVTARIEARARRGGVLFAHPSAVVFTVRNRKVARVRFYLERADAFRETGAG